MMHIVFDPDIYFESYLNKFYVLMFMLKALVTVLIFRLQKKTILKSDKTKYLIK